MPCPIKQGMPRASWRSSIAKYRYCLEIQPILSIFFWPRAIGSACSWRVHKLKQLSGVKRVLRNGFANDNYQDSRCYRLGFLPCVLLGGSHLGVTMGLPELSNSGCRPGRAGGSPFCTRGVTGRKVSLLLQLKRPDWCHFLCRRTFD